MKFIKKLLVTALNVAAFGAANGQTLKQSNEIALVKELNVANATGKAYRYSVDIKYADTDSLSQVRINTIQLGKRKFDLLGSTALQKTADKNGKSWETYTLQGKIAAESKLIWLYLAAFGNGEFCFDNIRFQLQNTDGSWQNIPIENADFESHDDAEKVLKKFKNSEPVIKNKNIQAIIARAGLNSCLCFTSVNSSARYETYYGYNSTKGGHVALSDGKKLYYEAYGQGETLILLHGNGGSINEFQNQIPEFAKHYRVIAIDTRAQGNSIDNDTQHFTYEQFANDLETVVQQLNLTNINIVGWSDGAITGLLYTRKHPEKVNKLVLMGANLNPTEKAVTSKIRTTTQKDINRIKKQNNPKNQTVLKLLEMVLQEPNIPPDSLAAIQVKTLVMAGEKDLVLPEHTKLIAQAIPSAELNIVKGETHFLPAENPALFNEIVLEFLNR